MKLQFLNKKDCWAGMMLIGVGVVAIFVAQDYPFGSTMRMGPGYFPSVLGGVLILLGTYVMIMGLRSNEEIKGRWSVRPVLLPLSMILFGVLMKYAGFIPALVVLIFGSAAASRQFKFIEVLLLTVVLTGFVLAVFVWGLRLPYPLIIGF